MVVKIESVSVCVCLELVTELNKGKFCEDGDMFLHLSIKPYNLKIFKDSNPSIKVNICSQGAYMYILVC